MAIESAALLLGWSAIEIWAAQRPDERRAVMYVGLVVLSVFPVHAHPAGTTTGTGCVWVVEMRPSVPRMGQPPAVLVHRSVAVAVELAFSVTVLPGNVIVVAALAGVYPSAPLISVSVSVSTAVSKPSRYCSEISTAASSA